MFLKKLAILFLSLSILSNSLMSQKKNDYLANWKKVEAMEKKGLIKSALKEVLTIYNLSVKDNNDAQQIKSCMYQVKYRNMVEVDSRENNIFFIDTLIAKSKSPAKNILQSMQAEMFWQYLKNNRYKFYTRTKLAEEKSKDIRTWSLDKLYTTISKLYNASLSNNKQLKETTLSRFEPVILKGENTRSLRPTLFDFLAHRALLFFMNDEHDLLKPAYQFTINDPKYYSPAGEFVQSRFITKDTTSLHQKAILLFQEIIQFHINDRNSNALLDADLIRLNFINQYAVNEDKNKLYEAALLNILSEYIGNPGIAQAMYLRARIYYERGQDFQPFTKTDMQYEIKRAKEICDDAIKKFPGSEGAINCTNLLYQLLKPSLNLETEKVNIPNQPFRTLVKYKNVSTVYFRIVKTSNTDMKKLDHTNYENLWKQITSLKPIRNWNVNLPELQDYQNHGVEIKIDALTNGMYFILASLDESFSIKNNIIAKQLTYISNISYIHNNNNEYNVMDRENGQPLPNTKVQVWETKYNYNSSQQEEIKGEQYTTDKNGYFKLKETKEYRSYRMQLSYKTDELFMDENNYNNYYNSYEQELKPITFLFTDRSIYRPGQIIYFKGIVIKKTIEPAASAILNNFKSTVILKDVNGEKINEVQLLTNEYGSYNGSFKLPDGLLNGQFSLCDETTNATQYFNVEEYKRPKFFVAVSKPTGTYRLYDSIKVTGSAKAYAGNNIDGATVKYRVIRKVKYPIWWDWGYSKKIMPPGKSSSEVEITNGELMTDLKGEFNITFKALPDESIAKNDQPTFYYEVNADITDKNGETRSGETSIAVAYQALQINIEVAEIINADSLIHLKIRSANTNHIFEKAKVNVNIQKVQAPDKIRRSRYWEMPDQFVMSKDEYQNYFPYDIYKDEDQKSKWLPKEKVMDRTDSTNANGEWGIDNKSLSTGWYKIIASAVDKYGEPCTAEKFVFIQNNPYDQPPGAGPVTVTALEKERVPGQKIKYSIQTGLENIWLIHTLDKMDKTTITTYEKIRRDETYQNEIDVTEKDRGGLAMSYIFVQHNRVYQGGEYFSIPWNNKDLTISYQTFRDKILPGSNEKWTAKITGNKGEKVAAEMLVSMYDASLDQFKPHSWSALNIWPGLYNKVNWMENGFSAVSSEAFNRWNNKYENSIPKSYDRLLDFLNSSFDEVVTIGYGKARSKIKSERVSDELEGRTVGIEVANAAPVADAQFDSAGAGPKQATNKIDASANPKESEIKDRNIQIRKIFNETAFFYPNLSTDKEGDVSFSFTIPEALTQWKLMTFAHTKELASAFLEKMVVTQKPLMVQPNAPRFMREGDRMELSAKIVNLSDIEITGTAQLELLDAATNIPVDGWLKNVFPNQFFTVAAGQSVVVKFPLEIPYNFNAALTYRIIASSSNNSLEKDTVKKSGEDRIQGFSDGEEAAFPILTNRQLVTETLPLNLRNTNKKNFKFDKLLNSGNSNTLFNHALTLEFSTDPVWYAVQALPYLMEYPYECAEQTFNRYYANSLAAYVVNSIPKIKTIFEKWKNADTAALLSNLQKNEELKSALLQETPWVLAAKNENQQKRNIGLLFDMVKMGAESEKAVNKLKEMQGPNGGFVWFKGGPDDPYITQYIITGIGHLRKLNALSDNDYKKIKPIVDKAIPYLDKKIETAYNELVKNKINLKNNNLGNTIIQYLYMRSFFSEFAIPAATSTAYKYYHGQAIKYWLVNSKYLQAMIALALHRTNEEVIAKSIIQSLKQNALNNEELGMYWKEWATGGYYWHQAPIESQSLMIEAFIDIDKNAAIINDLKTWLLKQKQTQNWKTTKATAEACYALLLSSPSSSQNSLTNTFANQENEVTITLGDLSIKSSDTEGEAGTGYFKKSIDGEKVLPAMGDISVAIKSSDARSPHSGVWGAVYWQYFEDLDKITTAATPLKLNKQLFFEKNTSNGPELQVVNDGATLKVGDKVIVRIELKVDREMEYVHMKDMRAACMEPVNVISEYKYQGGLGYYESTKDASTNFFFNWLARGTYTFEYPLFVTHAGNFSNGITNIQCMYAPEFSSHSEGVRVNVEAP